MPRAGGVGEQDAWLWEALGALRGIHNAMLQERAAEGADKKPRKRHVDQDDG